MNGQAAGALTPTGMDTCRIFLVGFMGSGKTALGRRLALMLGWPFLDLDAWIERVTGRSIPEIFQHSGELAFREWERWSIRSTATRHRMIVATGGGVVEDPVNLRWMKRLGWVIFCDPPWSEIRRRVAHARSLPRPVWRSDIHAAIRYRRRRASYRAAHWRITGSDGIASWEQRLLETLRGLSICCTRY